MEVNSSFYRPHRPQTYARWAAATPNDFRFAVKAPRAITHERRLAGAAESLDRFLTEIGELGGKLGPVLVQLPPSLAFEARVAGGFFQILRDDFDGRVACEPRHASWFGAEPAALLDAFHVARVAADPPVVPGGLVSGGWAGLVYVRLHGAPHTYYSDYGAADRDRIAGELDRYAATAETWCVFDNTAAGCATSNALDVAARLGIARA